MRLFFVPFISVGSRCYNFEEVIEVEKQATGLVNKSFVSLFHFPDEAAYGQK